MKEKVFIYDTTLRDGTQGEGISFSLADKLLIAQRLDEFGIDYVEGGWPGSNPKDIGFFREAKKLRLRHAKISAFGSTRRVGVKAHDDDNLRKLVEAKTPVVTIFGKTWALHVTEVLKTTLDENLRIIEDSVRFLKKHGLEVVYDAEHFFDGFKADPEYALKTIETARGAGAGTIVLCDTNGGTLCGDFRNIVRRVRERLDCSLGVHVHNDSCVAVANSVIAVEEGITHVQGTINGFGERCGNADLISIIPNIELKLGRECVGSERLKELKKLSHFVYDLANLRPNPKDPYVGDSAFAHKGGMHVNAVKKVSASFEHISPEIVGNQRRILVSELSGASNIHLKAREFGLDLEDKTEKTREIVAQLKNMESEGYEFEAAEGSLKLFLSKYLERHSAFFELEGFRVITEKRGRSKSKSEATIKIIVNGVAEHTAAEGDGPVNALDSALRKALKEFYPGVSDIKLVDYKVRVLDTKAGTGAKVRVLIESSDKEDYWATVGVSENIIEASWEALVDSVEYKLLKDEHKK